MSDYVSTGNIQVTVKDSKGLAIVGATATATPNNGGAAVSGLTNASGVATLSVNIGGYTVTVSTTRTGVGSQPGAQTTTVASEKTSDLTFNY